MKLHFFEYYQLSEEEIKKLWSESLFIFDANVLLDLYRYTKETSDDLIEIMKKLKKQNQLWIPHQVGYEFHKHRREIIYKQKRAYDKAVSIFREGLVQYIDSSLNTQDCIQHPYIKGEKYKQELMDAAKKITIELDSLKRSHPKLEKEDKILEAITECFADCTGNPYLPEKLLKSHEEAQKRIDNKIPPGYLDNKKDIPEKYGDYIVWEQIIDNAKETKKSVIFITRDQKEDWWQKIHEETISARYELIRELKDKAEVRLYMYETSNFIKHAKQSLQLTLKANTISEIKEITESDKRLAEAIIASQVTDLSQISKELTYAVKGDTGIASGTPSLSNVGEVPLPDIAVSK
ncbi:MAG: PIN domain-containing protein [Microgenomates group bacterium]|jgi:hypothetical protein